MRYWVVKMARDDSDPSGWLRKGTVSKDGTNHHLVNKQPGPGERCFYWQTAGVRQVFGLGTITKTGSSRTKRFLATHRADTGLFLRPLTIDELRRVPELRSSTFLSPGYSATFYELTLAEASLLYQLCVFSAPIYAGVWKGLAASSRLAAKAWRRVRSRRDKTERGAIPPFPRSRERWQLQARLTRSGQPGFRRTLRDATGGRCEVSGCSVLEALDACHIKPHRGGGTYQPSNGVLLRTDIHALMDAGLMHIAPGTLEICCAANLRGTEYWKYDGRCLAPRLDGSRPDRKALASYWGTGA